MLDTIKDRAGLVTAAVIGFMLLGPMAFAQTTETPVSVATEAANTLKDQFLLVMVAVIPIALVVVAAKRGYRFAKGQAR